MHESSKNVQACLADMYEPDWYGKNEVDSIVEVWNPFHSWFFREISLLSGILVDWVCVRTAVCDCVLFDSKIVH